MTLPELYANPTAQNIFNFVSAHLLKQNAKALEAAGLAFCCYRAPDGKMCAIGCLIPDEEYSQELEGEPFSAIENKNFAQALLAGDTYGEKYELLCNLQEIHDQYEPKAWLKKLHALAKAFNLQEPTP